MPIDRQFVITQQGKDYVLYGGLLDEAHRQGLKDIETTLAQVPGPENGHVAIVTATVRLVSPDGLARHFQGIGDASPENVNRLMAKALIRMAETRAKARALRDAINVAGDLLDDLPDAGAQISVPDHPAPKAPTPPQATPSPARSSSASAPAAATAATPAADQPPPNTLRTAAVARAEQLQADERLDLALGYRARPAPDNERQLRGHLTNLLRAADLNHVLLDLSHQPPHLDADQLGPAILQVETQIKAALKNVDLATILPAVPPKVQPAAGG